MLFYLSVLFCSIAVIYSNGGAPTRKVNVGLRYTTNEQFTLTSESQQTFRAAIGCNSAKDAPISVCAELPNNWDWKDFKGYVYMNVFNSTDTTNLDAAIASTGRPHSGNPAVQCTNIKTWPGGDMYIRVDANAFSHVVFTLSVKLLSPTATHSLHHNYIPPMKLQPQYHHESVPNDSPTNLTRVISVDESIALEYNQGVMLEIDLCFSAEKSSNYILSTTVLANTGVFTHFICKDDKCSPDSLSVIGRQVAPLSAGFASAGINHLSKVYVSVYNLGGELDKLTNKVMGHFRFGATLSRSAP